MLRWILPDNPLSTTDFDFIIKCYSQRYRCKGLVLVAVNIATPFMREVTLLTRAALQSEVMIGNVKLDPQRLNRDKI